MISARFQGSLGEMGATTPRWRFPHSEILAAAVFYSLVSGICTVMSQGALISDPETSP
jgi:hypothetical protein